MLRSGRRRGGKEVRVSRERASVSCWKCYVRCPSLSRLKRGLRDEDHQTKERNDRQSPSSPPPLPTPPFNDEDQVGAKNSRRFARNDRAECGGGGERLVEETRLEMGSRTTPSPSPLLDKGCRRRENSRITNDPLDFGNDPATTSPLRLRRGSHERERESFSNRGGGGKMEVAAVVSAGEEEEGLSSSKIPTGNLGQTRAILHNGERNANGGSNHSPRNNGRDRLL